MNNLTFLIILFIISSCSSPKLLNEEILVKQSSVDLPVIFRANGSNKKIYRIHFQFSFICTNNTSTEKKVNDISYYYSKDYGKAYISGVGEWGGIGVRVYQSKEDSLVRWKVSNSNMIKKLESDEFIIYTGHDINCDSEAMQSELKPYLDKIKFTGSNVQNDTLSIGSFKEFKQKHPKLTKTLLEGDSVRFCISDIDNKLDAIIVLPIKY